MQDAVRVNIERDFDLRHAARGGRDVRQMKFADGLVVARQLTLALQDVDFHAGLIVGGRRENFRFTGRDRRIAFDQPGEHAAERFDAEGQGRHIEQQHVFHFAFEHAALNGGADRDDFIRVHALMRRFVDQRMRGLDDAGHAGHAAHENQLVDFVRRDTGVFQAVLHRTDRALEQIVAKLFHFRPRQFRADMLRAAGVGGDERQIDLVNLGAGQSDLGLFGLFLDALQSVRLFAQVHAVFLFELVEDPIHDAVVPVVATEVRVTVRGFDFKDAIADFEHGDVERAAAQVVHGDFLVFLLVQSVSQGRRRRLVDDAQDFQAGNAAGVLGGLALRIVEVCRNRDDRLRDFFAKTHFGVGPELG